MIAHLFLAILFSFATLSSALDQNIWQKVQMDLSFSLDFHNKNADLKNELDSQLTSYWASVMNRISQAILSSKTPLHLLQHPDITNAMVRVGYGNFEKYEEAHLQYCLSPRTKKLIDSYQDNDNGLLGKTSQVYNCSTSTLGHLYYTSRIIDRFNLHDQSLVIVEFGGGYGNLAKIFKTLLPNITYVIFDLPQISAIQEWYLISTYGAEHVVTQDEILKTNQIVNGKINLVPSSLIKKITIKADVFISNFALTETSLNSQKTIGSLDFFGAKNIYITGQLNGWKEFNNNWIVDHNYLLGQLRSIATDIDCYPYHFYYENLQSYELIAKR